MSGILGPFGEHQEKENVKEFNSLIIGGQVQPHWRSLSCSSDSKSRELTVSYRRSIARWLDMGWWSWIWMIFDWIICDIILAMWLHVNMMIIDDIHYIYLYCFVPQQCHNSHFRPRNWDPISIQKPSSLHKDVQGLRCVPVFNTHLPMAGPCWECCWSEDFPGAKKAVAAHWCFCCVNCRLRTADVFVEWWILMDSILYIILFCITLYYIILY